MYIETANTATSSLYDDDIMAGEYPPPGVDFSDGGVARVTAEVGEALAEKYDAISVKSEE